MFIDDRDRRGGGWFQRPDHYRLVGKRVVRANLLAWGWFLQHGRRVVALTHVTQLLHVKSVFIGVDRGEMFETMIVIRGEWLTRARALTWGECLRNHRSALKALRRYTRIPDRPAERRRARLNVSKFARRFARRRAMP